MSGTVRSDGVIMDLALSPVISPSLKRLNRLIKRERERPIGGATAGLQIGEDTSRISHKSQISILQAMEIDDEFEVRSTHIYIYRFHTASETNDASNNWECAVGLSVINTKLQRNSGVTRRRRRKGERSARSIRVRMTELRAQHAKHEKKTIRYAFKWNAEFHPTRGTSELSMCLPTWTLQDGSKARCLQLFFPNFRYRK